MDKLYEIFQRYTDKIRKEFQKRNQSGALGEFVEKDLLLRAVVDEMEESDEFKELVVETLYLFSVDYGGKSKSAWERAVENFFRRSGLYIDLYDDANINTEVIFQNYCEAFERREIRLSYLAPMEYVRFAEKIMDFGSFQVRQFSKNELEEIFQNRINEIFYPYAVIDIEKLKDYWFIYLKEQIPAPRLGILHLDLQEVDLVKMKYTEYPKAIEDALGQLVLFDWQATAWEVSSTQRLENYWAGFKIPFVLMINDNLLDNPPLAPDFSRLALIPSFHPVTQEEIGEEPLISIHLDESETREFIDFTQRVGNLLDCLRSIQNDWRFIERALGYLLKAFFSYGLEQLLCHITTLEALLGEKGKGVTERLSRRIASILGRDENERKQINEQFKELYGFRSNLVHGSQFTKQVYVGHLWDARNLARRTLLWFMHYLKFIHEKIMNEQITKIIINREDILKLLELDKISRNNLCWLISDLPDGFPYMPDWIK